MTADFQGPDFLNFARTVDFRPRQTFQPVDVAGIVGLVKRAITENRRIRAMGSSWSFSDVAIANDYVIDTSALRTVLTFSQGSHVWGSWADGGNIPLPPISPVLVAALLPSVVSSTRRLAHVQAGITVRQLAESLDSPTPSDVPADARGRWALPTMGGSAGQTLAGVVSTSTHGGDFNQPPYPDMVRAIDIVMADGSRHWFERADQPITSEAALNAAFASDAVPPIVHYDTDAFLAVLVSMGSIGVIHSFVIEVVEQFGLSQRTLWTTWHDVKPLLQERTLFSGGPLLDATVLSPYTNPLAAQGLLAHPTDNGTESFGLELLLIPYRTSYADLNDPMPNRKVQIVCRGKNNDFKDPPAGWVAQGGPNQEIQLAAINAFKAGDVTVAGGWIEVVIDARHNSPDPNQDDAFYTGYRIADTYDYSQTILSGHTAPEMSTEIVVPTANLQDIAVIEKLLEAFDSISLTNLDDKFAGFFSIRYCQPSAALLAMQNFDQANLHLGLVCHIEIGVLHNVDMVGNRIYGDENALGLLDGRKLEASSLEYMQAFEAVAIGQGARLHWGHLSFTNQHNPSGYPSFDKWRAIRQQFNNQDQVRAFDNDFTTRYAISAGVHGPAWEVATNALLPSAPTSATGPWAEIYATVPATAVLTGEGCLEVFVLGSDGQVCWSRQPSPTDDILPWGWIPRPDARVGNFAEGDVQLSPHFLGCIAAGLHAKALHPELFVLREEDSRIYHAGRELADNTWSDWAQLGDTAGFGSPPDVTLASDDNLVVCACTQSQVHVAFEAGGTWAGWNALPDLPVGIKGPGAPSIVLDAAGLLNVFVIAATPTANVILAIPQTTPGAAGAWGKWSVLGSNPTLPLNGGPAAARHFEGALEVFAVNGDDILCRIRQTALPDGSFTWSGASWSAMDTPTGQPVVPFDRLAVTVSDLTGEVHVAALTTDAKVVHFRQQGTGYVARTLGGNFSSQPCLAANAGTLHVFVKFGNDLLQHCVVDISRGGGA